VIFYPAGLPGAFVIEPERKEDIRGHFARTYCEKEFAAHGLETRIAQCSISFNHRKGTLRGMHYQIERAPRRSKTRSMQRGAIYDVIIDLQRDSPGFKKYFALELNEQNCRMLYVPDGFAHGFQTLADNTEVFYQISQVYSPEHARGLRWNDPAFGISWPEDKRTILERDQNYPDFM
jgi:dTDP-4-dehydrorhamnose 3,5-epimerase